MNVRDLTFEPVGSDSLRIAITAVAEDGSVEEIEQGQQGGSVDDWGIDLAVRSIEPILAGEPTRIVKLWQPVCWFVALPEGQSTVQIDVRDYEPETAEPFPAESSYLTIGPLYVETDRLVESILAWCREYLDEYGEGGEIFGYDIRPFEQQLEDGEEMLAHYRRHGSLEGYQRTRPDALVEEYLFEGSYEDPAMREYVLTSGVIERAIDETLTTGDAETIEDRLSRLLVRDEAIANRTLEKLASNPVPRLLFPILADTVTGGPPTLTEPGIEAIAAIETDLARDELCRLARDPPESWDSSLRVRVLELLDDRSGVSETIGPG